MEHSQLKKELVTQEIDQKSYCWLYSSAVGTKQILNIFSILKFLKIFIIICFNFLCIGLEYDRL